MNTFKLLAAVCMTVLASVSFAQLVLPYGDIANSTKPLIKVTNAGSGGGLEGQTVTGTGVVGTATSTTGPGIGVSGITSSRTGCGVNATYAGTGPGTALAINGAIRVSGTRPAFTHVTNSANRVVSYGSEIDHLLCNGNPNALLFVQHYVHHSGSTTTNKQPAAVVYNVARSKWMVINADTTIAMPANAYYNVLIFLQ